MLLTLEGASVTDNSGFVDFRAGAVQPPRHPTVQKRIAELIETFPVAAQHRAALRLLGSDYVFAAPDSANSKCWIVYIRFGRIIENLFAITREIVAYYTPYGDLQIRAFDRLSETVEGATRTVTPDIRALYSVDPVTDRKLLDWRKGGITTIPLPSPANTEVDAAAKLFETLTEFLSTRDLYFETLPVTGEDFFGRRTLLLGLMRDIREHRVCGVFGLRKSGKTSVVKQVMNALGAADENWVLPFVDLETLPSPPTNPVPELISRVTAAMIAALKGHQLRTHELSKLRADSSIEDFGRAMKASLADSDKRSVNVLLALDEVEFMLAGDLADKSRANVAQFLAVLRALVQEHRSFLVLFSGLASGIVDAGQLFGRPNPFYSWAKPYFVGPLTRDEVGDLITNVGRRMALAWTDEAVAELYEATDGHAFYVRTLASTVVSQMPPRQRLFQVNREQALAAVREWKRQTAARVREIFETLESYYPDERTLLDIALTADGDLTTMDDLHPIETSRLISLGLMVDRDNVLRLGALPRLYPGARSR